MFKRPPFDQMNFALDALTLTSFFAFTLIRPVMTAVGLGIDMAIIFDGRPFDSLFYRGPLAFYPVHIAGIVLLVGVLCFPMRRSLVPVPLHHILGRGLGRTVFVHQQAGKPVSERSGLLFPVIRIPYSKLSNWGLMTDIEKSRFAHEYAHTTYRDYLVAKLYLLCIVLAPFVIIEELYVLINHNAYDFMAQSGWRSLVPASSLFTTVILILRARNFFWLREYRADAMAADLVGKQSYLSYLKHCSTKAKLSLNSSSIRELMASQFHPTFDSRIRALSQKKLTPKSLATLGFFFGALSISFGRNLSETLLVYFDWPMACFDRSAGAISFYGAIEHTCPTLAQSIVALPLFFYFLIVLSKAAIQLGRSEQFVFWSASLVMPLLFFLIELALVLASNIANLSLTSIWPFLSSFGQDRLYIALYLFLPLPVLLGMAHLAMRTGWPRNFQMILCLLVGYLWITSFEYTHVIMHTDDPTTLARQLNQMFGSTSYGFLTSNFIWLAILATMLDYLRER